jgi:hypothetical protein
VALEVADCGVVRHDREKKIEWREKKGKGRRKMKGREGIRWVVVPTIRCYCASAPARSLRPIILFDVRAPLQVPVNGHMSSLERMHVTQGSSSLIFSALWGNRKESADDERAYIGSWANRRWRITVVRRRQRGRTNIRVRDLGRKKSSGRNHCWRG